MPIFPIMRQNMVRGQLLPEGVGNPCLIEAFATLPREKFVPHQLASIAYMDAPFPIKEGRTLLRPATLARFLEACVFSPQDKVLYVGGGTGYGPALLGYMGLNVVALESEKSFAREREALFQTLSLSSIQVVLGPLEEGWRKQAPYDKILIEGEINEVPEGVLAQLASGGELLTFKEQADGRRGAVKYKRQKRVKEFFLFETSVPHLAAFQREKMFVFSGKETDFVYGGGELVK